MLWWTLRQAKSKDPQARKKAIAGLRKKGNQQAIDALIVLCDDRDKSVGMAAIEAVFSLGGAAERHLVTQPNRPSGYHKSNLIHYISARPDCLGAASTLQPETIVDLTKHVMWTTEENISQIVIRNETPRPRMVFGIEAFANNPTGDLVWKDVDREWALVVHGITHLAAFPVLLNKVLDDKHLTCSPPDSEKVLMAKAHFCQALESILQMHSESIGDQDLARLAELQLKVQLFREDDMETHARYHRTGTKDVPAPAAVILARKILAERNAKQA